MTAITQPQAQVDADRDIQLRGRLTRLLFGPAEQATWVRPALLAVLGLAGVLYLWGGLAAALWGSAAFVAITWLLTLRLPALPENLSVSLATVEAGD
ncbi:MAG: hypothetical protein WCK21_10460 [Actinomycetota bacterium]